MDYGKHYNKRQTPQDQPIPGEKMVRNNAGGFVYQADRWAQLERFLILGTEQGSYYVGEREMTVKNAENVVDCIHEDGPRVLKTIVEISHTGRAPKNDPALFALALCSGMGDEVTRKQAFEALPLVARTGTHLLHFVNFMKGFRGWGRLARKGVGNWFLSKEPDQLGYQYLKYAQRDGWALRDLLRLAHPTAKDQAQNTLFKYIVSGEVIGDAKLPVQVQIASQLNDKSSIRDVVDAIVRFNLPREAIPNKFLNDIRVWDALLQKMPMTALIRNLGKMSTVGLLTPGSGAVRMVKEKLTDETSLKKTRVHPITVLAAMLVYNQGRGVRGKLSWEPVTQIVDALDDCFYKCFEFIEPSEKNILIGLDVSGSMEGNRVNGMPYMNAKTASAAMCMAVAKVEPNWHIMAFTGKFVPLTISPRQRLDDIVRDISCLPFGRTDCSLPMRWALMHKVPVDAFIIYTDNETWYGNIHPTQALQAYRNKMGIGSKFIVNAMTATEFTIAKRADRGYGTLYGGNPEKVTDSNDTGSLDVAGLDAAAPQVMADFIRD